MTYDLPANLDYDVRQYAHTLHLSADEAAAQLIKAWLKVKMRKKVQPSKAETDWDKLGAIIPGLAFFQGLPDFVIDQIARSNKQIRSERLSPRA